MQDKKKTSSRDRSRVQSLMGNVVAAGAAVAVVVVALSSTVEAYFREIFIFEDKIFYQVEVLEVYDPEEGEPQNLPVRLVIQDQFGAQFIDLEYGITFGEVNNLKPNNLYTFKIQLKKDVGWITLTTENISTYPDLSGAVYEVQTNMNYLSKFTDLDFGVYVQAGIEILSEIYVEIIVDGVIYKKAVTTGDQRVLIKDFQVNNRAVNVKLYAKIQDGDLVLLHEKEFTFRPFFDAKFTFNYTSIEMIQLISEIKPSSVDYFVNVFKDNVFIETIKITSDITNIQVVPYSNYTFNVSAQVRRISYPLLSYSFETLAPPFSITQIYEYSEFKIVQVEIFEFNSILYGNPYLILNNELIEFELQYNQGTTYIFDIEIPIDLTSFVIYLRVNDQPDIEYILDRIGE